MDDRKLSVRLRHHGQAEGAIWHVSDKLTVPPDITLAPLPPKCPELSLIENIWQ